MTTTVPAIEGQMGSIRYYNTKLRISAGVCSRELPVRAMTGPT